MSAVRRLAVVLVVAVATAVLGTASAHAQASPTNPSGGTSVRQAIDEGTPSLGFRDLLSRGTSLGVGLRGWILSLAAARSLDFTAAGPSAGRTLSAILPRPVRYR